MTVTDNRPPTPPPTAGGAGAGGATGSESGSTGVPRSGPRMPVAAALARSDADVLQNVALTLLTVATALCLRRLFDSWSYLGPTLLAGVGAHAAAWGARRRRLPAGVGVLAQVGIGAVVVAWIVVPEATFYGLPTVSTWQAVHQQLSDSFRQFREVVAPAPVSPGFVVATIIGVVLVAALADWAAFRMRAPIEACIPSFALFIFTAALGSSRYRPLSIVVELAAVLTFLFTWSVGPQTRAGAWFASRTSGGLAALARPAVVLGAVALAAALILGPSLPGSGSTAIIAWKNQGTGSGHSSRTTVSPFVSIRERLVNQSGTEAFTVKASGRAYWRLTSLDTFDGTVWSSNDSYKPVSRSLGRPDFEPAPKGATTITQQFTITGLASIWLPAAFRPVRIAGAKDVSYNSGAGSLISDSETTDGITYSVTSALPALTPAELDASPAPNAGDMARFLALPGNVSARVINLARQITQAAPTEYDKAKALQDYLRSPLFTYDLNAPPGHGSDALVRFLFRTRRGYCEQFAGSYAVMARAIGLPTRVAVGFTPGDLRSDGLYHVLDDHAHAWPEVFFANVGWVAFEPTPGRGAPNAQAYTGVAEQQQATGTGGATPTTAPAVTPSTIPSTATPSTTRPGEGNNAGANGANGKNSSELTPILVGLLAVLLAVALWSAAIPGVRLVRRMLRRRRAGEDAAARVLAAWEEANDVLALAGASRRASETLQEHAGRASAAVDLSPDARTALVGLAEDATAASYAAGAVSTLIAERAATSAAEVESSLKARATPRQRLRWIVDPRTLFRR